MTRLIMATSVPGMHRRGKYQIKRSKNRKEINHEKEYEQELEDIAAEAEAANLICEAWNGKPEENIFTVMAELARMYVAEKKRMELPDVFGSDKE